MDKLRILLLKKAILKEKRGLFYLNFQGFPLIKINNFKFFKQDKILKLISEEKVFEYWVSEDLLIPPWETHWFQLNESMLLKLKSNLLKDLLQKALLNSNNLFQLTKRLGFSAPTFYNFLNKKQNIKMISIKKLKSLLSYLKIPYSFINNKVDFTKKGKKRSIYKPHFPINLRNKEGAKILGHIVSDGSIYIDKKSRNTIRTKFTSNDSQSLLEFKNTLNKIYGKVHINKENVRNAITLRIGSSIIGISLLKVGAILGNKCKQNKSMPWLIKNSNLDIQTSYLRAVFDDEGSLYFHPKGSYIILTRYKWLSNLSKIQKEELRSLEPIMKFRIFPTKHINKIITIKRALSFIQNQKLVRLIQQPSRLLYGESLILKKRGINYRICNTLLSKNHSGSYSVSHSLFINKKDSIKKFNKLIGFSLKRKQDKLTKIIGGYS